MRWQIVITGKRLARQKIVHRFEKRDADRAVLMVEQEIDFHVVLLPHADLDLVRHFEQGMNVAHLPKPREQIGVEMLMALGADVNGFTQAEGMHGHGRTACVEVFGVGSEDLAVLGFDDVAP